MDMHVPFSITELTYHAGAGPIIDRAVHVTHCEINDAHGDFVTKVYDNPELARFIVTACNNYEQVLEALKNTREALLAWEIECPDSWDSGDVAAVAKADKAIRQAEEQIR